MDQSAVPPCNWGFPVGRQRIQKKKIESLCTSADVPVRKTGIEISNVKNINV